mmetsp:Transcript_36348/g.89545  ORF Transcript_36348/g.89545 Transcript_36348/m.89545 type:complete len:312 (+) Transcript_36348:1551-2486(+)
MARRICSGILASSQERMGMGRRPPLVVMLKSSRKMRQSRSFISSRLLSDQCAALLRFSCRSYASSSLRSLSSAARRSSRVMRSPWSSRDLLMSASWCPDPSFFCTRRSTPARSPRPNSRCASLGLSYSGFRSRDVSSPSPHSKLNLNFSDGLLIFFFSFFLPMYCSLMDSSSSALSRSSRRCRRSSSLLRSSSRLCSRAQSRTSFCPLAVSSALSRLASTSSPRRLRAAASRIALLINVGFAGSASSLRFFSSSSSDSGSAFFAASASGAGADLSSDLEGGGSSRRRSSRRSSRRSPPSLRRSGSLSLAGC